VARAWEGASAPDGAIDPLELPPREYQTPRISPDGKRMVVGIGPGGGRASDLWVHDFERGSTTRLSSTSTAERRPGQTRGDAWSTARRP
jgi:Tol biopolymer transport system component